MGIRKLVLYLYPLYIYIPLNNLLFFCTCILLPLKLSLFPLGTLGLHFTKSKECKKIEATDQFYFHENIALTLFTWLYHTSSSNEMLAHIESSARCNVRYFLFVTGSFDEQKTAVPIGSFGTGMQSATPAWSSRPSKTCNSINNINICIHITKLKITHFLYTHRTTG